MKIEGLIVPIKNSAGFLFQKLEFDSNRMIMREKRALAHGLFLQPGFLGASISSAYKCRRIRRYKEENKLFFTFMTLSNLHAPPCGNISVDKGFVGLCLLHLKANITETAVYS